MFEHVTDHIAKGLARLPEQYQKDKFRGQLRSWLTEFQEIEDAFWALLNAGIATATGARLSQYGVLLGEPRQGLGDDELRPVLQARIVEALIHHRDATPCALQAHQTVHHAAIVCAVKTRLHDDDALQMIALHVMH